MFDAFIQGNKCTFFDKGWNRVIADLHNIWGGFRGELGEQASVIVTPGYGLELNQDVWVFILKILNDLLMWGQTITAVTGSGANDSNRLITRGFGGGRGCIGLAGA